MAKLRSQSVLKSPRQDSANGSRAASAAKVLQDASDVAAAVLPRSRQVHKPGEVNISAYFPAEVKASLRMVQAKTGNNVKDCLAEALRDLFRKHDVPVSVEPGDGR